MLVDRARPDRAAAGQRHPRATVASDQFGLGKRERRSGPAVDRDPGPFAQEGFGSDALLPGFRANPYKYMRKAAVFVLPSMFEGLPMVLVEALACGCPVVATDCPHGPREILEGGRWGRLVPVGDAEAMAAAIEETLASPPPAGELIGRAEFFRKNRAVAQYLEIVTAGRDDRN